MESFYLSIFLFLIFFPFLATSSEKKVHIVYLGEHSGLKTALEIEESHNSHLLSVKATEEDAKSSLVYSYKHSINGFAALLTSNEASKLYEKEEVLSVYPSQPGKYSLHTTRSWEFTSFLEKRGSNNLDKDNLLLKSQYGKNVIIGMLDTGVWPESESFSDEGMDEVPKSWKGQCQSGQAFNSSHCNKKLIGARYYIKGYEMNYGPLNNQTLDYRSPRDIEGHGTHTASTAGGRATVRSVSALGGFAAGTASGAAPLARLAIYKACWTIPDQEVAESTCFDEDILAAIDDAIADGIDVLSMSIGSDKHVPYDQDSIAIGTLHAASKDIVVACSAGNNGPGPATVSNLAPWIITVGASSIDRMFPSPVVLGNNDNITGETVTPYNLEHKQYPLAYAGQVVKPGVAKELSEQCLPGSLSPEKSKGKIVLCFRGNGTRVGKGKEVKRAGGIGFILGNSEDNGNELSVDAHVLPATAVNYDNALKIYNYIKSTKEPTAYIVPAKTVLDTKPAPYMAAFSSRGPNTISPNILKPDITAPGINILAAWSEASSPTNLAGDKRSVKYNIISGTSMACPHIGGTLALLKGLHPDWSSAAIRSALMTSAGLSNNEGNPITDATGNPADPFQFGSGHFRPAMAADPGLVYDASSTDYLLFLCNTGIKKFNVSFNCPEKTPSPASLNYPSLAIPGLSGTVTVVRTVTNVGISKSIYNVSVKPPAGVSVKISPSTLHFDGAGMKMNVTITVKKESTSKVEKDKYLFGSYTWSDGVHEVRSPMAISVA
ncbi:hypothetical protein CASFOL_039359 [Castilleja foliolosa]|uniref:Subtilisin-like protease SBT5.6 n=1 Tax=Castilleja foliolosa TaxID=1961234 RepID=A0ABD3BHR5_9LAMI